MVWFVLCGMCVLYVDVLHTDGAYTNKSAVLSSSSSCLRLDLGS